MKIMAVKSDCFDWFPRDVLLMDDSYISHAESIIGSAAVYLDRDSIENDPTYRQPIPYTLVVSSQWMDKYVIMQRMGGQGEKRLHGKYYVGAGGHVEEGHSVRYTALKELNEELGIPIGFLDLKGVMITTGGSVEDVHLCMFHVALTNYIEFNSPEKDLHNATWASKKQIVDLVPQMEKWSQIIVRDYLQK